ncbi:MAG: BTAD domain-containing putative transcriptional regulator [Streptosporangiaceae bacterium]
MARDSNRARVLLRGYRRAAGLTQSQLAAAAGVSIGVIRDLEQGRSARLQARSAFGIVSVLGLDARGAGEFLSAAGGGASTDSAGAAVQGARVGVLGPLAVWRAGGLIEAGPPARRVVLGLLALCANELVHRETLVDALWDDGPPATAVNQVQGHVSALRRMLDPGRDRLVVSTGTSYRLRLTARQLDLLAFADLAGRAQDARSAGDAAAACDLYEEALKLWRGEPLADVDALRPHPIIAGLNARRDAVTIAYAEAACQMGAYDRALPVICPLARREPLDERAHAVLMLALAGSGRQAAALEVFTEIRRRLDEQLGVGPCAELADSHLRVLRGDLPYVDGGRGRAVLRPPAAVRPPVPRQLPPAPPQFTGRAAELATLTGWLDGHGEQAPPTMVISVIGGMAGVGKTALAVHWAHQVAGRFGDGQLYVNLHGYDPGPPVTAADALAGFLRALGVAGQDVPPEKDERAARFRSLLAGKQMLVVLDNAGSAEQVRPLLPGNSACAVVVTSRDALAGLVARDGASGLDLGPLSPADADGLVRTLIGPRADNDPGAVGRLAAQCARLPLALRVAAELAAARPAVPLARLASELADQQRRPNRLDAGGDPRTGVRTVFSWSYRHLDADTARAFRLAGLHPGPDLGPDATAALAGIAVGQADRLLDRLVRAHLLEVAGPGRFGLHDLLRAYARELAIAHDSQEARGAAVNRLVDHYLHTAAAAMASLFSASRYNRPANPAPAAPFPPVADRATALAWLDTERASLVAVVAHAAENGWPGHATRLAAVLSHYLDTGAYCPEAAAVHTHARSAARRAADRAAEADALSNLGVLGMRQGRYRQARVQLRESLALCRQAGDSRREARTLNNLGLADLLQGRYEVAADHLRQSLALCEQADDRFGEGRAMSNLGMASLRRGRYWEASYQLRRALVLSREFGDPDGEANTLTELGVASVGLGRSRGAAGQQRLALARFREIGNRVGQTQALNGLGEAFLALRRPASARAMHLAALSLASRIGQRSQQARAHNGLAHAYQASDSTGHARRHWQAALALYFDLGTPEAEHVRAELTMADLSSDKDAAR